MTHPNVTVLRDLVMIKPKPVHLSKSLGGIITPGDIDKMAPKRATVIACGPGFYVKDKFVPNPFKPGDQVLYMERNLFPMKVEDEDYLLLQAQDVIAKLGKTDFGPDDTLPEMTDDAYHAETLRREIIAQLKVCGLTRVQDMLNAKETFVASDGETITVEARSFMVTSKDISDYIPPEDAQAFSMYGVKFVGEKVVVRLAFLPRTDVTLG